MSAGPRPALAADPDSGAFLDAAAAAGLPCREVDEGSWHCEDLEALDDRSFFATVDDQQGFGFSLSVYRGLPEPAPAEPEVLGLMDRFMALALGGDDPDARAWLVDMHESRAELGSFERNGWTFDWYAGSEDADDVESAVQLIAYYNPAWEGEAEPTPTAGEVEPCTLLTPDEVEAVTGMDAQPGVEKETGTVNQFGCGWGTEPYEVQVSVSPSINGPAVEGLGSMGYPVDGLGDAAEWWWCDTCAEVDASSSTNLLVVAAGTLYLNISFEPETEEAADDSENVHETHRGWAIQLAQLILPRLAEVAGGTPAPSASTDGETGAAPTVCLAEEVVSAIEAYSGLDPVTQPPADEVADALAALELTGTAAEARDALVSALSTDPPDEASLALGANRFRAEVGIDCSVSPAPSSEPAPIDGDGGTSGGGVATQLRFDASIPAPAEVSTDPVVLLQSAALAALLVFLMPFPSQLFNSTLETHEDEVKRWIGLERLGAVAGGVGAFWASWPGVVLFTGLAALLYGFLDPGFGFDLGSLAAFLGMLLGIVLVTVAFAVPTVLAQRRHGERPSLKVVPVSLLIGVACVLLSRLTSFQPGYLYGLLIGLAFARELSQAEEGRATAVGAILMLAVAFLAWVALGVLPGGDGFALVVGRTALAALMVAGLEGVVFGLLPMRFLPGESLYAWNRVLWAALLLIGAFAFFHILINPASGYLSDTSRTPLLTVVALLVGFSLISIAFWAWFRFRRPNPDADRAPT